MQSIRKSGRPRQSPDGRGHVVVVGGGQSAAGLLVREFRDADRANVVMGTCPNRGERHIGLRAALRAMQRRFGGKDSADIVRRDIAAVTSSGKPWGTFADAKQCTWQTVLYSALSVWNEYSQYLSAEDQDYFDREVRTVFFNYSMPMALDNAVRLQAMVQSGHLDVMALGRQYTCEPSFDRRRGMELRFVDCAGRARTVQFTDVVNARGQCTDFRRHPSAFIRGLLRDGLIQPALRAFRKEPDADDYPIEDCNGREPTTMVLDGRRYLITGGMYVNPTTCELIPDGHVETNYSSAGAGAMYAMGPNLVGQFVDAQGLNQIQRDSARIVTVISARFAR